MSRKCLRGSEWLKWDLHIHTPYSLLNNGYGNDFNKYVVELFTRAIEHNIAAIGITDYFTIDGYRKIKEDYLGRPDVMEWLFPEESTRERINDILLLPNIEFRLNKFVGKNNSINLHVIFSNEISIQDIEQNFLHRLEFCYEGAPQKRDLTMPLTKHNVTELGKKLKKEQGFTEDDYVVGLKNIVISDECISNVLSMSSNIFLDKHLICIPADEDLSHIDWKGRDHNTRKVLIQKSDILFASNPNTIQWALGEKAESIESFIDEFKSIKPCINGSDAHDFDSMFKMSNDRYCWIKAEPTFNGLRQILYEPKERVRIQKPDEKQSYYVIDKVKITNADFMPDEILFQ